MLAITIKAENIKDLTTKVAEMYAKLSNDAKVEAPQTTESNWTVQDVRVTGYGDVPTTPVNAPAEPTTQVNAPVESTAVPTATPTAPVTQEAPQTAPTAPTAPVKEFSLEEIQVAMQPIMDAGGTANIVGLMQKYGVASLPELPKDAYPNFVVDLRALGARI